ncbi:MAG: hypothetical protein J6L88_02630 [Clostridia bacterium]|nr:hypothetical protein [Clostridia bacterium]
MKTTVKDIAAIGVAAAILLVCQVAMNFLPNIEVVSLFVVLFTQHFERKTLWIIYVFVLIEGLIYGFAMWWFVYLYIWTILYFVTRFLRDMHEPLGWAIVTGLFGLLFGALSSIPTLFTMGFYGGIAYFVQGIIFDLVHCAGNFVIALVLYRPMDRILGRILQA